MWIGLFIALLAATMIGCGGGGGGGGKKAPVEVRVVAANDLGMHCMDREFSVFSILPPFNVVRAQVVDPRTGEEEPDLLDDTQVRVVYQAVPDAAGSVNSTSKDKTDFWTWAEALFGAVLQPGEGLTGLYMPADAPVPGPQEMAYDAATGLFEAFGIPITPIDDAATTNTYPLLRILAYDLGTDEELAHLDVVVPVSQETECQGCHATGEIAASDPDIPWSMNPDREKQAKENILILHDEDQGTDLVNSQPVLCAGCHYSTALDLAGTGPTGEQVGKPMMSTVMHEFHGLLTDGMGDPIFPPDGTLDETCYQCHPGRLTRCARGAMAEGGMECFDCHGDMLSVGGTYPLLPGGSIDGQNDGNPRRPWIDMPRCQACHTGDALDHLSGPMYVESPDGIRLRQAYLVGDSSASPIYRPTSRFAENANTLYRFSKGHGGIACEHCHGSTHAEWPTGDPHVNDNVAANQLQGHPGKIIECATCHDQKKLEMTTEGPHGLHNVGDKNWLGAHRGFYKDDPQPCKACHGANLEGTVLSRVAADRSFNNKLKEGVVVSCDLCHEKPD